MASPNPNSTASTSELCMACGICCNGAMFGYVGIDKSEKPRLDAAGLVIAQDNKGALQLTLGCPKLHDNCCSIYQHRPEGCAKYFCKLSQNVMDGIVTFEDAAKYVADAKARQNWLLANAPDLNIKIAPPTNPMDIASAYTGNKEVTLESGLSAILEKALPYFVKKFKAGTLTQVDNIYIEKALAFLKLLNIHFQKNTLLPAYETLQTKIKINPES